MRVVVTGASGFVGKALCSALLNCGHIVRAAVRDSFRLVNSVRLNDGLQISATGLDTSLVNFENKVMRPPSKNVNLKIAENFYSIPLGYIDAHTDWSEVLDFRSKGNNNSKIDCIIHCAARVYAIHKSSTNVLSAYRAVNVAGTRRLAEQAVDAGVRRLVFLSSVKVNGESTSLGAARPRGDPFMVSDIPAPEDAYALSKLEAEQCLWEIASQTGLEVVVVRPPLIYGPGVKGNFKRLIDLLRHGIPLPLAAVNNQRSFIGLDNLIELLIRCLDNPRVAGQTLLVSDGEDLSTPELLRIIANAMGCRPRLFPVPVNLLRLVGRAMGRLNEVDRLVGSLQVDNSVTRELLDWKPSVSVREGIRRMIIGGAYS